MSCLVCTSVNVIYKANFRVGIVYYMYMYVLYVLYVLPFERRHSLLPSLASESAGTTCQLVQRRHHTFLLLACLLIHVLDRNEGHAYV